eukprot:2561629-Pleurochrysis_carterae.AAC.4
MGRGSGEGGPEGKGGSSFEDAERESELFRKSGSGGGKRTFEGKRARTRAFPEHLCHAVGSCALVPRAMRQKLGWQCRLKFLNTLRFR